MIIVLIFFPDYRIPIPKEYLREAIGQFLIFILGLGIILNELIRGKNIK